MASIPPAKIITKSNEVDQGAIADQLRADDNLLQRGPFTWLWQNRGDGEVIGIFCPLRSANPATATAGTGREAKLVPWRGGRVRGDGNLVASLRT
jgi:hypothetical protein